METAAEHESIVVSFSLFPEADRDRKGGERGIIIVRCPHRQGAILQGWSENNLVRFGDLHFQVAFQVQTQI